MPAARVPADGFRWGDSHGPAATLAAVRRACVDRDGQDPLDEASALLLKNHGLGDAELWLAGEEGFALRHAGAVDLAVAPDARGRGLGEALASAALGGDGPASAWSHGDHPAAARLAARHGMERVRELWVMRRPTARALPEVAVPDGVSLRSYEPGDARELLRVNAAAFETHPEQGALDEDGLAERMAEDWFDAAGLLVAATPDDHLLGFHWTKRHGPTLGEVYVVGIDPAAQGRGLGRVLTVAGLEHLARTGADEVLLYVEADNRPALALYSGLGFGHAAEDTHVQYRG